MKTRSVFDYIGNIAQKTGEWQVGSDFGRYITARYLSFQHPSFTLLLEQLNRQWEGLTDQMFYDTVYGCIPRHRVDFKAYVKKPPKSKGAKRAVVEQIAKDLQISQREAESYLARVPELKKMWESMDRKSVTKK
jgi:hypothetical protein